LYRSSLPWHESYSIYETIDVIKNKKRNIQTRPSLQHAPHTITQECI